MTARHWTYFGLALLLGAVLLVTLRSGLAPLSPAPAPVATPTPTSPGDTSPQVAVSPVVPAGDVDLAEASRQAAIDVRRLPTVGIDPTEGGFTRDEPTRYEAIVTSLKGYQDLWLSPKLAKLQEAEPGMLARLEALPPAELVALMREGLGTSPLNLVQIALENMMRGPQRSVYETALLMGMEQVFERPDKLEIMADITLRATPSPANAEAAARLLMKHDPSGRLAELLGGFAARLQGEPRLAVKQFAVDRGLVETLVWLIDDRADVVRLESLTRDPNVSDRVRHALLTVNESTMNPELRQHLEQTLAPPAEPK